MKELLKVLYHNKIVRKLIPTLVYCLEKELRDCDSVLDLGCGSDSPLQYCKNIKYSVGVEVFKPYLILSKKKKIHSRYINKKIQDVNFKPKSFDAVILLEVLEHLSKKEGETLLRKIEKKKKKKVIVSCPNGFIEQKEYDKNPYQKHLSGWSVASMRNLGYKSYGLAGLKYLRIEREADTKDADLTTSIRFWPRPLWFIVASLSQMITYFIPELAFELFNVKNLSRQK